MTNYFCYARKSTESDERQVQSIDDQLKWIGKAIGNNPIKIYTESKSAKDPDNRTEFKKLINDIKKSKGENILLSWKLDRLSRNPVDSGMIQYLMQKGTLTKIITNDREYFPVDSGLLMSVENAMSNQFILDMVKNVERGMKSKIEKGGCIQNVPLGYINNKSTKQADIDEEKAPFIKEIFILRSEGKSYTQISEIMELKGLKSKSGGKVTKGGIESILKNPFYIGFQRFQGQLHKSVHKSLVSVKTWENINNIKRGYKARNKDNNFALKGIVKSYHTKKALLALFKKEKYVYYSTHNRDEFVINMNENHIIKAFDEIIHFYVLPKESKTIILKEIQKCFDDLYIDVKEKKDSLNKSFNNLEKKSSKLLELVCNDTISEEKYKEETNSIVIEQERIKQELSGIHDVDLVLISESKKLVELFTNLDVVWRKADKTKKLEIIKIIVVELFVDTKKQLYVQETELFELVKVLYGYSWQPIEVDGGTFSLAKFIAFNGSYINDILKKYKNI